MTERSLEPVTPDQLIIGLDVGSTTVKAVVVDPKTDEILWKDYQRHNTKQPEKCLEFLERIDAEALEALLSREDQVFARVRLTDRAVAFVVGFIGVIKIVSSLGRDHQLAFAALAEQPRDQRF